MYVYEGSWALSETCPCDVDFVAWLQDNGISGARIFHFGTGGHHTVGITAGLMDNAVLGVTASYEEYALYQRICVEQPDIARRYKVLWGDAYILEPRLLPEFDVVTLFHLCEWGNTPEQEAYGAMDDLALATMLADKLVDGGRMLFYAGSMGFARARDVIPAIPRLAPIGEYRSLLIYRRT